MSASNQVTPPAKAMVASFWTCPTCGHNYARTIKTCPVAHCAMGVKIIAARGVPDSEFIATTKTNAVKVMNAKPAPRAGQAHEEALEKALHDKGITVVSFGTWLHAVERGLSIEFVAVKQYPFGLSLMLERKYRADVAFPLKRILVEVDGGCHVAGKAKFARDTERRRLAAQAGWTVLPFTPEEVRDGTALAAVEKALAREGGR